MEYDDKGDIFIGESNFYKGVVKKSISRMHSSQMTY
jgi:hypothetical protein